MMATCEDDLTVGELWEVCVAVSATIGCFEPKRLIERIDISITDS